MNPRQAMPNQSFGTWRGESLAGGSGSGMGQRDSGVGMLPQGLGSIGNLASAWEPSIWYLVGFVIAELVFFHVLGRVLK